MEKIYTTINMVLGFVGTLIAMPIWIIGIILVVLGIIGLFTKNFVNFKKGLKIWGYFWLAFLVIIIIYFINAVIFNNFSK